MIFSGTFEHTLDAKHRLTLPAAFREMLIGRVTVALSPETEPGTPRSVAIWTPQAYEQHAAEMLAGTSPRSPKARDLKRLLFSGSWPIEIDSAHRVMIPAPAMQFARLDKEVTVTGSGDCLEVWDRRLWSDYIGGRLESYSEIVASLDDTD